MNKNLFVAIIAIIMIIAGCIISYLAKFDIAQISGLAVAMFGAGIAVNNLWKAKKAEAKTWMVVLSLALIVLGSFLLGLFSLLDLEGVKNIISMVFSVIVFIAGVVFNVVGNKINLKEG